MFWKNILTFVKLTIKSNIFNKNTNLRKILV